MEKRDRAKFIKEMGDFYSCAIKILSIENDEKYIDFKGWDPMELRVYAFEHGQLPLVIVNKKGITEKQAENPKNWYVYPLFPNNYLECCNGKVEYDVFLDVCAKSTYEDFEKTLEGTGGLIFGVMKEKKVKKSD